MERDTRRKSPRFPVTPRGQIPIEPAAPPPHYLPTRFRALALFGRRPPERVERSSLPASENLPRNGHHPLHSITSSSIASRVGGRSRRSAFPVLRLTANSNSVAPCAWRSDAR